MDDDLKSVASARRCAESAFEAYRQFLGTDPAHLGRRGLISVEEPTLSDVELAALQAAADAIRKRLEG